jgi:basic amino acid/polyamine antiporter, APA family
MGANNMAVVKAGLKREIGVFGLSANIVNIIVGSGIFVLPAIIAAIMGASSIVAYLLCGFLVVLIMLCFAEAGSRVTRSGGGYAYVETAFGPFPGFMVAAFCMAGYLFADAAISNALVNVVGLAFPVFKIEWVRILFLLLVFSGLAAINVVGVKQGIGLVKFNTIAKLSPLLLLIAIGFKDVEIANFAWTFTPTLQQLGEASLILFFAFQGGDAGLNVGGEVKEPRKTIPKAIFIGIGFVVVFYILIQTVSQGVLGSQLPGFKEAPLAEVSKIVFGPIGFTVVLIGMGISMFGALSGQILNNPRVLFAMAKDKVLPVKAFGAIHAKNNTPYIAIIVYAMVGFFLATAGGFKQLAVIASASMLLVYFGVAVSVIKLRKIQPYVAGTFRIPFGFTVPVLAACTILYFLSHLKPNEKVGVIIFAASVSLIYLIIRFVEKWRLKQ